MVTQNLEVDSKGRLLVPNSFRGLLGLKGGCNIVAYLDEKNRRLFRRRPLLLVKRKLI